MADRDRHICQARRNVRLLSTFSVTGTEYADWGITVAFYTALHLLEAYLAGRKVHLHDHSTRNSAVAREARLRAVGRHYMTLYWESRHARYNCRVFRPADLARLLNSDYNPLQRHLCKLLGIADLAAP